MNAEEQFRAGLSDADDAPALAPPPNTPNWTENIWWIAYDSDKKVGLMLHLGSTRHNFNMVRQTIMLMLPDGRVATDVSVGGLRGTRKVRGATLEMECVDPFHLWHITSNGVAQAAPLSELWNNSPRQAARAPLTLDIKAECLGPVWVAGAGEDEHKMQAQQWAKSHYQQTIRLSGSIEFDGVRYDMCGTGVRDHSRGPRDFSTWAGHALCSAPFPSGRSFGLFSVFGDGGAVALSSAYVVKDGVLERGIPRLVPRLTQDFLSCDEAFSLEIDVNGRLEHIQGHVRGGGLLSMLAPYDVTPGIYRDQPDGFALAEGMTVFEWDGETTAGITERSAPSSCLPTT